MENNAWWARQANTDLMNTAGCPAPHGNFAPLNFKGYFDDCPAPYPAMPLFERE